MLVKAIGVMIGKMHDANIIHGDITTSNIMIKKRISEADDTSDPLTFSNVEDSLSIRNRIVLIDFGLAMSSSLIEDKAVDLYVLQRAFSSTHPNSEYLVRFSSTAQLYIFRVFM